MADWDDHDRMADAALAEIGAVRVQSGRLERIIWDAIIWGAQSTPPRHGADYPSYTDSGNSDAETECRATVARILAAIEPAPVSVREADLDAAASKALFGYMDRSDRYASGVQAGVTRMCAALRAIAEGKDE